MKSNYNKVINDIFPEYLARGRFDIDEVVDEVMSLIEFDEQPSLLEVLRIVIKARTEVFANNHDCFSFAKNQFVYLNQASIENLITIDESFVNSIKSRKKTLDKIRAQEEIRGQMRFDADGSIREENNIDDVIETITKAG